MLKNKKLKSVLQTVKRWIVEREGNEIPSRITKKRTKKKIWRAETEDQWTLIEKAVSMWKGTIIKCIIRENVWRGTGSDIQAREAVCPARVWQGWGGVPENGPLPKQEICCRFESVSLVMDAAWMLTLENALPQAWLGFLSDVAGWVWEKRPQGIPPEYKCGYLWIGELWVVFFSFLFPWNFHESKHFTC